MTATLTPRGYRETDRALLRGHWLPRELLAVPLHDRPALAAPTVVETPGARPDQKAFVVEGLGLVRYLDLDWVHRRARLEICTHGAAARELEALVRLAVAHGFTGLNLRRLFGWRTPALGVPAALLDAAGLTREGTVPRGSWLSGDQVDREIWGVVRDA